MKTLIAGILTAVILAAMLLLGLRENFTKPSADPQSVEAQVEPGETPAEEAVRKLIRSGDEGNVSGYLEAFSGPIRARLEREVAARGREAFADDLKRAAAARKGHAVFAAEPDGEDAARVVVETIYPDRNERQTYRVARTGDEWQVAEVATVKTHQPSVPFGTSANPSTPEEASSPVPPSPKVGLTVETGSHPDSPD